MSLPISFDPTNILILLRDVFKSDKKKSNEFEEYLKRLNHIQNELRAERLALAEYESRLDVLRRVKKKTNSEPPHNFAALSNIPEKDRKLILEEMAHHDVFKINLPFDIENLEDRIRSLRKSIKANEKSLKSNEEFIISIFRALRNDHPGTV
jgi:DNA repair ATPase RecN